MNMKIVSGWVCGSVHTVPPNPHRPKNKIKGAGRGSVNYWQLNSARAPAKVDQKITGFFSFPKTNDECGGWMEVQKDLEETNSLSRKIGFFDSFRNSDLVKR